MKAIVWFAAAAVAVTTATLAVPSRRGRLEPNDHQRELHRRPALP
jgi:hypothetical protein